MNLNIYILDRYLDSRSIEVLFKYITFIVNNLRAKMLININIFISKDINFIISKRINYINNYNIIFKFIVTLSARPFIK